MREAYLFEVELDEQLDLKTWRVLVKLRGGWRCEDCGSSGTHELHAHHLDGNPANGTLRNGRALCQTCHIAAHTKLGTYKRSAEYRARQRESQVGRGHTGGWHQTPDQQERRRVAQRLRRRSEKESACAESANIL